MMNLYEITDLNNINNLIAKTGKQYVILALVLKEKQEKINCNIKKSFRMKSV